MFLGISKTSTESFRFLLCWVLFIVFATFRNVFAVLQKVFEVLAMKRNGFGGISLTTITLPYGNIPNLSLGCFLKET